MQYVHAACRIASSPHRKRQAVYATSLWWPGVQHRQECACVRSVAQHAREDHGMAIGPVCARPDRPMRQQLCESLDGPSLRPQKLQAPFVRECRQGAGGDVCSCACRLMPIDWCRSRSQLGASTIQHSSRCCPATLHPGRGNQCNGMGDLNLHRSARCSNIRPGTGPPACAGMPPTIWRPTRAHSNVIRAQLLTRG